MNNRREFPLYRYRNWLIGLWIAAFAFYHMAWSAHKTAFATQNAFDLAEQVSIHPAIRAESPALRTSGFLRLPVPLIAAGIALMALLYRDERVRWILRGVALLIALRVIPPENALRNPGNLPELDNAFQLAQLAVLGILLVVATIPLQTLLLKHFLPVQIGLCLLALVLPMIGLNRALRLWHELQLDVTVGGGAVLYGIILLIIGGITVFHYLKTNDPVVTGVVSEHSVKLT